jgi:hypothetical protein
LGWQCGGMVSACKHKVLSSNTSTAKKKEKKSLALSLYVFFFPAAYQTKVHTVNPGRKEDALLSTSYPMVQEQYSFPLLERRNDLGLP